MRWRATAAVCALLLTLLVNGCGLGKQGFRGSRALKHVAKVCSFGPRPVGSDANRRTSEYIERILEREGWVVEVQEFAYKGEYLRNVVGRKGDGPVIVLAAHFDTRPVADRDPDDRSQAVIGANAGASGMAVLLELARVLDSSATGQTEVWLAFVDGGDHADVEGWPKGVGSRHLVGEMAGVLAQRPEYVVVLDMIGDDDQRLYYDWSSMLWLQERIWQVAADLGYRQQFVPEHGYRIQGDHSPFLQWGVSSALLIDADYPYWRTAQDTPDKVSAASLQRIGDVMEALLEGNPFETAHMQGRESP